MLNLSPAERKSMGLHGRNKMEVEFDQNIVLKMYIKALEELNV